MLRWIVVLFTLLPVLMFLPVEAAEPGHLVDRGRALAFQYGTQIWPGFEGAPFGILVVDGAREFLFCHDGPASDFSPADTPAPAGCRIKERPASFPPDMLASFPAVDGRPTIVMGTPDTTGLSRQDWLLILQHEHFHQMQHAWEGYYSGVNALELSGDDESGMWMLNYPFPYDDPDVGRTMRDIAGNLKELIGAASSSLNPALIKAYWAEREAMRKTLSPADWRYLELQLWQEGVARWTELAIAGVAPGFETAARSRRAAILSDLEKFDLAKHRRTSFYSLGAAEALLLDSAGPQWRKAYWTEPFSLARSIERLAADSADIAP